MPNKHLIFVVISFFTVAIISGSFFKFDVFGAEDSSCVPDFEDKSVQYCCYKHEGHTYCATCYQRSHGTWNCRSFDRMYFQAPEDTDIHPRGKDF